MSHPKVDDQIDLVEPINLEAPAGLSGWLNPKRLRGGLLFALGYLLSPLCWWNDLIFNLPVAYGFGYLCSLISANWMLPGLIIGYWLSNVVGFLLMQFGATDAIQSQKPRQLRRELLTGLLSSTVYTLVVVALVQFHILDPAALLPSELLQLGTWGSRG
jgi:hypothetical protein